ncbi:MAG: 2-isopropylmalate synthase [Eubacteriales bacterium]|nr:2-isopropylmalate synthase [Eubacteriales bacterium]
MKNCKKYSPGYYLPPVGIEELTWYKKDYIEKAPTWCSVDLRDGNQALIVPMNLDEKLEFFNHLVKIGFKEIEIGFPAASQTEFEFTRCLIENDLIPDDVTIQVLTQSRAHIIERTFEAVEGAKNVIVHLYNSTSFAQRQQVFRKSEEEIIKIATDGAQLMLKYREMYPSTKFQFQYSPESFTGTEMEFALDICNAVIDVWKPTPEDKTIINLPATVEMSLPHIFANQIEYMSKNLHERENVVLSLHPHNDRGTGVADAELGILAGADRIEGTLFGNGERTGNVDIVTLAINMYTHGVDPHLDFTNIKESVEIYERVTGMSVGPRQPYGGKLVFAAFSGSHQDAISKGMKWREETGEDRWTCPYLPLDPHDIGRTYDKDIIRINSQSGKGGVAYILENSYGYIIPKAMMSELGYFITGISDNAQVELQPREIYDAFKAEYVNRFAPIDIIDATFNHLSSTKDEAADSMSVRMAAVINGQRFKLEGDGNGRLDAVSNALRTTRYNFDYDFVTYSEHAISGDSNSKAAAYVCIADKTGRQFWGVGTHADIILASVNALVTALNRMNEQLHFVN